MLETKQKHHCIAINKGAQEGSRVIKSNHSKNRSNLADSVRQAGSVYNNQHKYSSLAVLQTFFISPGEGGSVEEKGIKSPVSNKEGNWVKQYTQHPQPKKELFTSISPLGTIY